MTERKGSLIQWLAECGHWMVCYSLEPTPTQCPDCADKATSEGRSALKYWLSDISTAASHAGDCGNDDVAQWLREDGIRLPGDVVSEMQSIADICAEAASNLDSAHDRIRRLMDEKLPKAERLTMPDAS